MNFFEIFSFSNPWYWIFIIPTTIFLIILYKFSASIIGKAGEHWVKGELKKLDKNKYKVLNDIMINTKNGTSQIDHIVISKYGIFVIETKQYNGYITGNKYDKKWIRHLKRRKKIFYTNPIRQNYGHVISICELLNMDESKVFNVVCISSTAKIKIKDDGETTRIDTLLDKILSYNNEIIDNVDDIYNKILSSNIIDKKIRKEHVKNLRNKYSNKDDNNICPRCGNTLVLRNGKYGVFYGCSSYPKCKYIRKIK